MIELHHLNSSRSRRITWLLEELGVEYTVVRHERDPQTRLAPPTLLAIHPLGKAPVLRDNGTTIIESGAIVDYLIRHYGAGRFMPAVNSPDYEQYVQFMHYAEGSAALPLLLKLYVGRLGDVAAPLNPRIESEIQNHIGWLDSQIVGRDYFVGNVLTGADFQLIFIAQIALLFQGPQAFPNLSHYVARLEARPAYARAIMRHGA
jgi:glutathione S-transferase